MNQPDIKSICEQAIKQMRQDEKPKSSCVIDGYFVKKPVKMNWIAPSLPDVKVCLLQNHAGVLRARKTVLSIFPLGIFPGRIWRKYTEETLIMKSGLMTRLD